MMMTIDFEVLFKNADIHAEGEQKKIDVTSALGVYYGITIEGNLRLAFRSSITPPRIESTKLLVVTQGEESSKVHWTCFDLTSLDASPAFYAFCRNMVESIVGISDEADALNKLKRRYICWKALFKYEGKTGVSKEMIQGLFGELFFLEELMISKYGVDESILSWSGPDSASKDFSINNTWYEVKTIGANASTVKISSIAQLSSDLTGHLCVVRVEKMSDEFTNGKSSILEILSLILNRISSETIEDILLSKIAKYGINLQSKEINCRFDVKGLEMFTVTSDFPRISINNNPFPEITNVAYEISVSGIQRFLED